MLKVLQVIPTLDRSGAEKQMVMLATGLPRDQFRVEVAALTRSGPLAADLRAADIPTHLIGKRFKVDPFALARLARLVRRGHYDVVHTWIFAADSYGRVAARWGRVPAVVVSEMAVDVWKGRGERAVDRWLARWTDRVVGNSDAVVRFYEQMGIPSAKLSMIPSGIADEPALAEVDPAAVRTELGILADAPVALFVGRLADQKGVADLLDALDLLQHVRPDLRTWIVGDGPLRDRLRERARGFRLDGDRRVQFLGHREDVPRLLAACDVLVLPSYYEGMPNVVLEAMQAGKPVVATAAPGTTEVVAAGETGLLVPIRNPPALAQAIRQVIADPALARRFGEAGRGRVASEFSASAMIAHYARLYCDIAGTRSSRTN